MPLNRPALALGPGPRGVQDARRWVVEVLGEIGRTDLLECAELGTSELVTNALLHGGAPITVRVRGTREHPRIEVRDGSPEAPRPPEALVDDDDVLLTFGRGLSIVARCSTAWGADLEDDGKTVWFVPADRISDTDGPEGLFTGTDRPGDDPVDPVTVRLRAVPTADYQTFARHFAELRREVRLLALSHRDAYPEASRLARSFDAVQQQLRAAAHQDSVTRAVAEGRDRVDLDVVAPRRSADALQGFLELLDLADDFCRRQQLLSLARSPEQRAFQQWYLGEFVRQARGEEPQPYAGPSEADGAPAARSAAS